MTASLFLSDDDSSIVHPIPDRLFDALILNMWCDVAWITKVQEYISPLGCDQRSVI